MIGLPRRQYDSIVEHATAQVPEEACGILGGTFGEERSTVSSVHAAENVAQSPRTRYYIDPEQQLEITEEIEASGGDVVGFYHSHPAGPPGPSPTDTDRATWPNRSYVIVALDGYPYVGSWRWRDADGFQPEAVSLV